MKKTILIFVSACCLLSGCGSSKTDSLDNGGKRNKYAIESDANTTAPYEEGVYDKAKSSSSSNGMSFDAADAVDYEMDYEEDAPEATLSSDVNRNGINNISNEPTKSLDANKVSKEMLVFRGSISIDTIDFNESVEGFKKLLNDNGGFVFSERYTDNARKGNQYVIEEKDKRNIYTATIRVPSNNYDALMNGTGTLGDVREKDTEVTNLTKQYSTYKSQLEIYEKEYKRYMDMLEKATSDSESKEIQNKLFELDLQIANLKTGMGDIEMDVAYSYIDVTIVEVDEYVEEDEVPEEEKTFSDKVREAFDDAVADFKEGVQDILLGLISNLFAVILTVVFVLVFIIIIIVASKKHKKKKALTASNIMQANVQNQNGNNMPMINGQVMQHEMMVNKNNINNMNPSVNNVDPNVVINSEQNDDKSQGNSDES